MTQLEKIKSLIQYLPKKDIPIANKLIENREYESLLDLVVSDMERIEKYKESNDYDDVDLGQLNALRYEVSYYLDLLYPDDVRSYEEY